MRKYLIPIVALTAVQLVGCAAPTGVPASGRVSADTSTVSVPTIPKPGIDPNAGFNDLRAPDAQTAEVRTPAVSEALPLAVAESVPVGESVRSGQQLVKFDSALLAAALQKAMQDQQVAEAKVAELSDRKTELADRRQTVRDNRKKLKDARAELASKRAEVEQNLSKIPDARNKLQAAIADLTAKRQDVKNAVGQLEAAIAGLPEGNDLPQIAAKRAQLTGQLSAARGGLDQLDTGLAKARSQLTQVNAAQSKANRGLATIKAKQGEVNDGLRKLDDADTQLDDAETKLDMARTQASSAIEARRVAVDVARHSIELATVTAPSDGVVVSAPQPGEVVLPGAKLVEIRPVASTAVVWVEDATGVCQGARVSLTTDINAAPPGAHVQSIGVRAEPPLSSFAASGRHSLRAIPLIITLEQPLPPGLPVSAIINPCQS